MVTIVEVPFQNLLQTTEIAQSSFIWLDKEVNSWENNMYKEIAKEKFTGSEVSAFYCETIEQALQALDKTVKAVLIVSGSMGQFLLPRISPLKKHPALRSVIVFCWNVARHQQWAANHPLVSAVYDDFSDVLDKLEQKLSSA